MENTKQLSRRGSESSDVSPVINDDQRGEKSIIDLPRDGFKVVENMEQPMEHFKVMSPLQMKNEPELSIQEQRVARVLAVITDWQREKRYRIALPDNYKIDDEDAKLVEQILKNNGWENAKVIFTEDYSDSKKSWWVYLTQEEWDKFSRYYEYQKRDRSFGAGDL